MDPHPPGPSRAALDRASRAQPTYPEVGASAGPLPAGYRHVRRTVDLGAGCDRFDDAARRLMAWEAHRGAGLRVAASTDRAELGADVVLRLGRGPLRIDAPCRVVLVVDEPRRRGFAYGTLPGHPERGEELFTVTLTDDDRVLLQIAAFSRPARWWSRVGGPVARRVQDRITDRYAAALVGPTVGPTIG